jgi:hypothetical protein
VTGQRQLLADKVHHKGYMGVESKEFRAVETRAKRLEKWLMQHAPECVTEQKHLDEGSQERRYWNYGYVVALRDVLRLMTEPDHPTRVPCSADKPNTFPLA